MDSIDFTIALTSWVAVGATTIALVTWVYIFMAEWRRRPRNYLFITLAVSTVAVLTYYAIGFTALGIGMDLNTAIYFRPAMSFLMTLFTGTGVFASINNDKKLLSEDLKSIAHGQQKQLEVYQRYIDAVVKLDKKLE